MYFRRYGIPVVHRNYLHGRSIWSRRLFLTELVLANMRDWCTWMCRTVPTVSLSAIGSSTILIFFLTTAVLVPIFLLSLHTACCWDFIRITQKEKKIEKRAYIDNLVWVSRLIQNGVVSLLNKKCVIQYVSFKIETCVWLVVKIWLCVDKCVFYSSVTEYLSLNSTSITNYCSFIVLDLF